MTDKLAFTHTPGPWFWAEDYNLHPVSDLKLKHGIYDNQATAIVSTDSGFYGPHGADKDLIKAAPDLLEACESFIADYDGKIANEIIRSIDMIRAAIAKAKGETGKG